MRTQLLNLECQVVNSQVVNDSGFNRYKYMVGVRNIITNKATHFHYHTSVFPFQGPEVKDFLQCLLNDARDSDSTLEEFCADMNYNPKNTDDIATYQACKKIHSQLKYLDINLETFEEQLEGAQTIVLNEPSSSEQDDDYYATI